MSIIDLAWTDTNLRGTVTNLHDARVAWGTRPESHQPRIVEDLGDLAAALTALTTALASREQLAQAS